MEIYKVIRIGEKIFICFKKYVILCLGSGKMRKEEIIKICAEIKKNNCCACCGGSFEEYTCKYCSSQSLVLEELINDLNGVLFDGDYDEDILNSLYSIKDLKVGWVDDILVKNDYEKRLEHRYRLINERILGGNPSVDDDRYVIYFLDNNLFLGNNRNFYINYMMRKLLLDELDIKVDDKLRLIKHFTEMNMKEKVVNPRCSFEKLEGNVEGISIFNLIELDKEKVIGLLEQKDYFSLLELIFHECTHTFQGYLIGGSKIFSYTILKETKEMLIRKKNEDYYWKNYVKDAREVEARYYGAILTLQYLNFLGLEHSKQDYFEKLMKREEQLFLDDERIINGERVTVDEAFSRYVDDGTVIKRFPVLGLEYINSNGVLRKKSRSELLEDYNNYKNGKLVFRGNSREIDDMYNYLLRDQRVKTK